MGRGGFEPRSHRPHRRCLLARSRKPRDFSPPASSVPVKVECSAKITCLESPESAVGTMKQDIDSLSRLHVRDRRTEVSASTSYNQESILKQFRKWCDVAGLSEIDDIGPLTPLEYRDAVSSRYSTSTLYNHLSTLRTWLRWCADRGLIDDRVPDAITLPDREGEERDETIDAERIERVLAYLNTFEYATFRHALVAFLVDTGARIGAVQTLDTDHLQVDECYVEFVHRPAEDLPLKNGNKSEREVNLRQATVDVLVDYMHGRRHDTADSLFTSSQGRPHTTTLRNNVQAATRPCWIGTECPHDRDMEACEATNYGRAYACPSSVSPHVLRRTAITALLREGHSIELVADRVDVSVKVLEKHYDGRSESEKRELRRTALEIN